MVTKKIFLASSSELKEDRQEFEILINRKNKLWIERDAFLELVVWEDFLDAVSKTRLQDEYNKAIRECDIFVMLFCTKVGPYTGEEFETAFGAFQKTNRPLIFVYFKDVEISTGSANRKDLMSVWAFQEKLDALGHFRTTYKTIDGLKFHFTQQLDKLAETGFFESTSDAEKKELSSAPANAQSVNAIGDAVVAQGPGSVAVGRGGVSVTGTNTGTINTGSQQTTYDSGGGAIVFGGVSTGGGSFHGRDVFNLSMSAHDLERLFAPLLSAVASHAPPDALVGALQQVQALKAEVSRGQRADDGTMSRIIEGLATTVPRAVEAVVTLFGTPVGSIAGATTARVLDELRNR